MHQLGLLSERWGDVLNLPQKEGGGGGGGGGGSLREWGSLNPGGNCSNVTVSVGFDLYPSKFCKLCVV